MDRPNNKRPVLYIFHFICSVFLRERRYERITLVGNVGGRSYPECGVGGGEWGVKNWLYVGPDLFSVSKRDLTHFPSITVSQNCSSSDISKEREGKSKVVQT